MCINHTILLSYSFVDVRHCWNVWSAEVTSQPVALCYPSLVIFHHNNLTHKRDTANSVGFERLGCVVYKRKQHASVSRAPKNMTFPCSNDPEMSVNCCIWKCPPRDLDQFYFLKDLNLPLHWAKSNQICGVKRKERMGVEKVHTTSSPLVLEKMHLITNIDGNGLLDFRFFSYNEIYHLVIVWMHKGFL